MTAPAEMTAFVRAASRGGFSSAAREMGLTPSGVAKLVTRLEGRLGVRLLNRTTRKLSLTAEGNAYFQRARRIVADIEDAEAELASFRRRPKGLLRINVLAAFARSQLIAVLPRFIERHPEIELEVELSDRRIDLVDRGIDLAVRLGALSDSSLVARKICDAERVICASPEYLARRGTPRRPEDLLHHSCIGVSKAQLEPELVRSLWHWPFMTRNGRQTVEVPASIMASDGDAVLALAIGGVGICRVSDFLAAPAIAKGSLQPIMTDIHDVVPLPLHAVYAQGRHRSPKIAAMVDFLFESFAGAPWRRQR